MVTHRSVYQKSHQQEGGAQIGDGQCDHGGWRGIWRRPRMNPMHGEGNGSETAIPPATGAAVWSAHETAGGVSQSRDAGRALSMHGGKSTGPRTPEGLEASRRAQFDARCVFAGNEATPGRQPPPIDDRLGIEPDAAA